MMAFVQRKTRFATISGLALLAMGTTPAGAVTVYHTVLSSLNQVPPQESSASGTGELTLASDDNSFSVVIDYAGLSSSIEGAHVHCCASASGNAPIAVAFSLPAGNPSTGVITGTYNLTLASTYTSDFLTLAGGTATAARTYFLNGLTSGLAYLNVHSTAFPAGEIRGQLPAMAAGGVPEPSSWAMIITGFALVGGTMRRRANAAVAA